LSIGNTGSIGPMQPGSSRGGQGHDYPGQDISSLSPKRNNRSSKYPSFSFQTILFHLWFIINKLEYLSSFFSSPYPIANLK
jgi:hypothetical protein